MLSKIALKDWLIASVFVILTVLLGYFTSQSDFYQIITYSGLFFIFYGYLIHKKIADTTLYFYLGVGVFCRFILLFAFPNLSDDIYRFIWDGRLLLNGLNPFDHLPTYYHTSKEVIPGIIPDLFEQLNSPEYFTIYPPVAQLTFAFSVWLFPNSIYWSGVVMKMILFLFEIGSILLIINLLKRFKLPLEKVLIYALNPLIIIEICGNLHFEGAMIFFFLLAMYWLVQQKWSASGVAWALSIASKLLPLIFLPFLIRRLHWRKCLFCFLTIGTVLLITFLPLFNGVFLNNFGNSLNLYFQKFEFNASVYYICRWIGYQKVGWNLIAVIGPTLAVCTLLSILLLAAFEKIQPLLKARGTARKEDDATSDGFQQLMTKMLFAICFYLMFTTTVHPWYLALPLVLCIFTKFRFPILWSGMIMLTYINYSYAEYAENLWIVVIEYFVVGIFLLYELILKRKLT